MASSIKRKIVIVDDHPLFRDGLVQLISGQKDLICCGSVGASNEAIPIIERDKVDLLVLDLRLHGEDGLQVLKTMRARFPQLPVLVLSQFHEDVYGERALRAGASGYVMKEEASDRVLQAINAIFKGEIYASRTLAFAALRKLIGQKQSNNEKAGPERLSDRELQVFEQIGRGRKTKEIASLLQLSPKTIETYRENIKDKLDLADADELNHAAKAWIQNSINSEGDGR